MRNIRTVIVLIACSGIAGNVASQSILAKCRRIVDCTPSDHAYHGAQSHRAFDDAIAGALISTISQQLGGRAVDMKLDAVEVRQVSIRDRVVSGTGSLEIDGNDDWLGFRFQLVYDSQRRRAGYPEVRLGGVAAGERDIPNDAQLVQQLEANVVAALSNEFRQHSVWLQLDRIATVEAGSRYLGIDAAGIAYLSVDGSTAIKIEALYDRSRGEWLRLHYGLEPRAESGKPSWSRTDGDGPRE